MHVSMCTVVDSAFFDIRVCHPNADSYKELSPKQICKLHEDEKKRKYASRIIEVENGTFTPLVFTTTGGYVSGVSAVSFQACRAHLFKEAGGLRNINHMDQNEGVLRHPADCPVCLRGTRSRKRKTNVQENDLEMEKGLTGLT